MSSLSPIESRRFILRPLRGSVVDDVLAFQSNPDVVRFIPWPVRDASMVSEALLTAQHQSTLERQGDYLNLAITHRGDGRVVGQVNATYVSEQDQCAEIGYVVNPAYSGSGYALEAATALVAALFATPKFRRVIATGDTRNVASHVVLERLGFRREVPFHEDRLFKGEWINTYVVAVLRHEWEDHVGRSAVDESASPRGSSVVDATKSHPSCNAQPTSATTASADMGRARRNPCP